MRAKYPCLGRVAIRELQISYNECSDGGLWTEPSGRQYDRPLAASANHILLQGNNLLKKALYE